MTVRHLLIALWLSVLFLPFRGFRDSSLLFLALVFAFMLWRVLSNNIQKLKPVKLPMPSASKFWASGFLFAALLPAIAGDYALDVAVLAGIYAILGLGLNVIVGFAGLLNLGYAAFYAIGAYSYAILNTKAGLGFWQSLPLCMAITTLSGLVLSVPALRLRGDYLAIVTLGFGEIVRLVLNNWDGFTNGPNGISGIMPPTFMGHELGSLTSIYYITLACLALTVLVIKRVHMSKTGRAWIAIREDEIAASASGINIVRYKVYAFAFGTFWAGIAGALFSAKMRFVSPESFTFMESVFMLCMVILGGLGSIGGTVLGAVLLVLLPELLREVQLYRMLALGAGLVILMIFRPQGLVGGRSAYNRG